MMLWNKWHCAIYLNVETWLLFAPPPIKISAYSPGSRMAIVWPEFWQSCPWKCSVSRPKWYKAHVAVTEKFTITNILKVVIQLQLEFCKSMQYLLKYPTKNHHNFLQNHAKSISTWSLSNHKSSKIFLNIRSVVVTTRGMQIGLSGGSRGNCLIACPPPNSSSEECEKYRHLK